MTVGDVLVLSVDDHVAKAVGGPCRIQAIWEFARVDSVRADHRGMPALAP
jgi:hypothetical protein